MPRTYRPRVKVESEKTARKYPCGCLVRSTQPVLDMRACHRHHIDLSDGSIRTYEQAMRFVEDVLGSEYKMVAPPRPRTPSKGKG